MSDYDKIIQRLGQKLGKGQAQIKEEKLSQTRVSVVGQELYAPDIPVSEEPKGAGFLPRLTEYEYQMALELKGELHDRYRDLPLDEVISGQKLSTSRGSFFYIFEEFQESCFRSQKEALEKTVLSFFPLIPGIREYRENQLKKAGFKTLEDLSSHPRWGQSAKLVLGVLSQGDQFKLQKVFSSRLPKSHPLMFGLSSFHPWEDFLFLDIETLGLFGGNLVILIGMATLEKAEKIMLHQFLVLNPEDEIAALAASLEHLNKSKSLVSFNGKAFDLPFLEGRMRYYGMRPDLRKAHFDLLPFSRRAWRKKLPDCSLGTIEKDILKQKRGFDLPSCLVPEFYSDYMKTKNYGFLKPIVEHNRQDVLTLVRLFFHLHRNLHDSGNSE